MNANVRCWTHSCIQCQCAKCSKILWLLLSLSQIQTPNLMSFIILDIIGPLLPSQGYTYLLTCVAPYWQESIPLISISTLYHHHWLWSTVWITTMVFLDVSPWLLNVPTPYSISPLGQWYGWMLSLTTYKTAFKAQPNHNAWMDPLPLVLLGIKTALKKDISSTSAEIVYGTALHLPGDFFTTSHNLITDPTSFVTTLRSHFQKCSTSPT